MRKTVVSIIIPVLNNKNQFEYCLKSIIASNTQIAFTEIIVIDGGSSDDTVSVIRKYEENITYWETGKDSGIADAFNRGVTQATGDIVAILNSDDYWHENTLKRVIDAHKECTDVDVFYGDLQFSDESTGNAYRKKPNIHKMKYRMNIFHPAMFVKRAAYEKIGGYSLEYKYAMDSEWCHRAIKKGLKFKYIPYLLTTMRLGGVSDRMFKDSLQEYRQSIIYHDLARPWQAWMYYVFFITMKTLMNFSCMKVLKRKLRRENK